MAVWIFLSYTNTEKSMEDERRRACSHHLKLDMTSTAASLKPVMYNAAAIASAHDSFVGFPGISKKIICWSSGNI